jgi:Holliday junction resolvase
MTLYAQGDRVALLVRDHLQSYDYAVVKAAGSRGIADLVAFRRGFVLFVQVKKADAKLTPADRAALLGLADLLGTHIGVPLVATKPFRKAIEYRVLTGPAASDFLPWQPIESTGRGWSE